MAKVAVCIPAVSLERLDAICRRERHSRSSAVAEAVSLWLRDRIVADDDRRYVEAYLKTPERTSDVAAIANAVISTWEPWE
jgi:metal-responsive CopG/Arc/MetJ family transcriptional regulator